MTINAVNTGLEDKNLRICGRLVLYFSKAVAA